MATENQLAVNETADGLFTELSRIPKYGEVQKALKKYMCEKTFAKYYPVWRDEKESLLKNAQKGVIEGEIQVPAVISDAFSRAWAAEVHTIRTESAAQLAAAKTVMTQDVRDLLQKVADGVEATELLAEQLDEARQLEADWRRDAEEARAKNSELQLDNAMLTGRIIDLEKQASECKAAQLNAHEELKKTIGKLGGVEAKLSGALAESSRLAKSLAQEQERTTNLQTKVQALTQQAAQADDEAKRLKVEITTLRTERTAEKAKNSTAKHSELELKTDVLPAGGAA